MKRRIISALLIVVSVISLISCGGSKGSEDALSKSGEEVTDEAGDKEVKDNSGKVEEKKKLDDIEKGLSDLESYKAGTTADMKYAAGEEYKRWDKALNEIYSFLKENLSKDEMKKLEAEETKWIKDKEDTAKKDGDVYKGGTAEGVAYTSSLAQTTKKKML